MKTLVIGWNSIRRLLRDRVSAFFIFVLPLLIILLIGSIFGGDELPRMGVVSSDSQPLAEELVGLLRNLDTAQVERLDKPQSLEEEIQQGRLAAGLVIPANYDARLRGGGELRLEYLARRQTGGFALQSLVEERVVAQAGKVRAARLAAASAGIDLDEALAVAGQVDAALPGIEAKIEVQGKKVSEGRFDLGAAQNLISFMFITALAAASALVQSRKFGVTRRILSTPTRASTVILGEVLGRFLVVMLQGLFIMAAAGLLFGVKWGNWAASGALVVMFALVATGAAVLVGAQFDNEEKAGRIGTFAALGLAALGGAMVPLEVFSDGMRRLAHVTPHAWAIDGLSDVVLANGGLPDVVRELAVLAGFAAVLLGLSAYVLRRSITG